MLISLLIAECCNVPFFSRGPKYIIVKIMKESKQPSKQSQRHRIKHTIKHLKGKIIQAENHSPGEPLSDIE